MLVPEHVVDAWYLKDSWVYKNFTHLFQNKLWHVNVPRGFSVCPYFWLAIGTLLLFRPAEFIFYNTFGRAAHFTGPVFQTLDFAIANFIFKFILGKELDSHSSRGAGKGLGLLFTVLALLIAGLLGLLFYTWTIQAWQYGAPILKYLVSALDLLPILGLGLLAYSNYQLANKIVPRCAVVNYLKAYIVGVPASILVIWPKVCALAVWSGIKTAIIATGYVLQYTGIYIWYVTVPAIGHGIAGCCMWCIHAIFWAVTFSPCGFAPVWMIVLAFAAFAFIMAKLSDVVIPTPDGSASTTPSTNREAWLDMFASAWIYSKDYSELLDDATHGRDQYMTAAIRADGRDLLRRALAHNLARHLHVFDAKYPVITPHLYSYQDERVAIGKAIEILERNDLFQIREDAIHHLHRIEESFRHAINEKRQSLEHDASIIQERYRLAEERRAAYKNSWAYKKCVASTELMGAGLNLGWSFVVLLGNLFWAGMKQIGIFFVYLWILAIAQKKKACPYKEFRDGPHRR